MKRILLILVLITALLIGCSINQDGISKSEIEEPPVHNGITVNTITFKELTINAFNEKQKEEIEQLKKEKGFIAYANSDGGYYVVIFRGEKPSTGYDITVKSVQDNEGHTNISVQEIDPVEGTKQGEAITYPTTAIEIKNVTNHFYVSNLKGEEYQKLN